MSSRLTRYIVGIGVTFAIAYTVYHFNPQFALDPSKRAIARPLIIFGGVALVRLILGPVKRFT